MKAPTSIRENQFLPLASLSLFLAASFHASAAVSAFQAAVIADSDAMHLWSFDGDVAGTRQSDSVGSNNLSPASYGATPVAPSFGTGFDASSNAVTITRTGSGSAFATSSIIAMPNTMTYEAIVKPGALSSDTGYIFAAFDGSNRSYFSALRPVPDPDSNNVGSHIIAVSGNSFNNQGNALTNLSNDDWYYLAVTMSYDGGQNQTTINTWSANLSNPGGLTKSTTSKVVAGTFIINEEHGIGLLSNQGNFAAAFPGEIDEIALYSGLKDQAFFANNLALIVPEPSGAMLALLGAAPLFLRRRRSHQ